MVKAKIDRNYKTADISNWNVRTFHDYLTDRTKEKYGVTYQPFGQGAISNRWRTEQGQIKNAMAKYGNVIVKAFIDENIRTYTTKNAYPFISFGFMIAYKVDEFPRVEAAAARVAERLSIAAKAHEEEVDTDWF